MPDPCSLPTTSGTVHRPHRGDDVEAWLKRERERRRQMPERRAWEVVDDLLDRYRECSDYGLTLRPDDDEKGDF